MRWKVILKFYGAHVHGNPGLNIPLFGPYANAMRDRLGQTALHSPLSKVTVFTLNIETLKLA